MTEPPNEPEKSSPPPQAPPPPGYSPPPAYPAPPPMPYNYQTPPPAPRNGLGTTALVLAIIGLISCWSVVGGILLGLIAVILGIIGRGRVKRGEATNGGVAMAGIILGFLSIIAGAVFIVLYVYVFNFFKEHGGQEFVDCMNRAGSDTAAQQECQTSFEQTISTQFSISPTTTP